MIDSTTSVGARSRTMARSDGANPEGSADVVESVDGAHQGGHERHRVQRRCQWLRVVTGFGGRQPALDLVQVGVAQPANPRGQQGDRGRAGDELVREPVDPALDGRKPSAV